MHMSVAAKHLSESSVSRGAVSADCACHSSWIKGSVCFRLGLLLSPHHEHHNSLSLLEVQKCNVQPWYDINSGVSHCTDGRKCLINLIYTGKKSSSKWGCTVESEGWGMTLKNKNQIIPWLNSVKSRLRFQLQSYYKAFNHQGTAYPWVKLVEFCSWFMSFKKK